MTVPDVGASIGKSISEAPIGAMILSIASGIAEAQQKLDLAMLRSAILLTGEYEEEDGSTTKSTIKIDGQELTLLELGFTPTFYQFADTTIEVKISMSMKAAEEDSSVKFDGSVGVEAGPSIGWGGVKGKVKASVSSVTTMHTSKYQYSAEASSSVRTRIVPVPPPALLEERLRRMLDKKYSSRR